MPAVQRSGDANALGGVADSDVSSVLVNGRPIMAGVNRVSPHPCCPHKSCFMHCIAQTQPEKISVFAEGEPIILTGFPDSCRCPRSGGSPNVFIGR